MDNQTDTSGQPAATGFIANIEAAGAAILGAVEHPIATVERAAGAAVAEVEAAGAAVKVELEDLVAKVRTYFHSTSAGHLEDALVAIANRVQAMEATVTDLRAFVGK